MKPFTIIISCEHGVNFIPEPYVHYFAGSQSLLESHRGIDFGALSIAEHLSQSLKCKLIQATTSRLLIDCNRSLTHRHCFSEISKKFSKEEKTHLVQTYYLPYRSRIEEYIRNNISLNQRVLHLSIHSFTPVFNDIERSADVGLLYDPKRQLEKTIVLEWQRQLQRLAPSLRIRRNYPYQGISDGFTSYLRQLFSDESYAGIELENNQALTFDLRTLMGLIEVLLGSLLEITR